MRRVSDRKDRTRYRQSTAWRGLNQVDREEKNRKEKHRPSFPGQDSEVSSQLYATLRGRNSQALKNSPLILDRKIGVPRARFGPLGIASPVRKTRRFEQVRWKSPEPAGHAARPSRRQGLSNDDARAYQRTQTSPRRRPARPPPEARRRCLDDSSSSARRRSCTPRRGSQSPQSLPSCACAHW